MKKYSLLVIVLALGILSCTQSEFMPDPYGEPVPYVPEERKDLYTELTESGSTLFKLALENSTIPDSLGKWGKLAYTILVPSDEAFVKAGLHEDMIRTMRPGQLDTIILYHTLSNRLDTANVHYTAGNIKTGRRLFNTSLRIGTSTSNATRYNYPAYLAVSNNTLLIDGRVVGQYKTVKTTGADIMYIDTYLVPPTKDIWTFLSEDDRFSMYKRVIELNDSLYRLYSIDDNYVSAITGFTVQPKLSIPSTGIVNPFSIFLPTNEAFTEAGYTTPEDLVELNYPHILQRGRYLYFIDGYPYNYRTFHKIDSVLTWHLWGERYYPPDGGGVNSTAFFSNELTNEHLGKYILSMEVDKNRNPAILNPFVFSNENGTIKVKLKNAKEGTEAATIIEKDISLLNGIVHVVDRLFIPEDF